VPVIVNGAQQTYTKVCLIVAETAAVTANLSASTKAGNVLAHGTDTSGAYSVYARVIVQASDQGAATALANSVVITAANGTVTVTPDHLDSPNSLQVDFELFTMPGTALTLNTDAGNLTVDNYNSTLHLTTSAGDASLDTVQGDVSVSSAAGSIGVKLMGAAWTGTGMTATTRAGNVSLMRPAGYAATFTAESDLGTASIDDRSASTVTQGAPATVTAGSGAPVMLKTMVGDVSVGQSK
jgi:hypothetical protein